MYSPSPENRRSLTVIEAINATGRKPPPPFVVIQGKKTMGDWFPPEMDPDSYMIPSDNGFTTDEITLRWLHHFIKTTASTRWSPWKLLLMDNHGSHMTQEFSDLANAHNIRPYPILAHLSHCMQPCDCGTFWAYKHWHQVAVKDAILKLDFDYSIRSFIRDLPSIRTKTFTKHTIRSAWKKCGMWPIRPKRCLKLMQVYSEAGKRKSKQRFDTQQKKRKADQMEDSSIPEPELPRLPREPLKILNQMKPSIYKNCSSPTIANFEEYIRNQDVENERLRIRIIYLQSDNKLLKDQAELNHTARVKDLERKSMKRTTVEAGGKGLYGNQGLRSLEAKAHKNIVRQQKDHWNLWVKQFFIEKHDSEKKGKIAKVQEAARKRQISDLLLRNLPIPNELDVEIVDPFRVWNTQNAVAWQEIKDLKKAYALAAKDQGPWPLPYGDKPLVAGVGEHLLQPLSQVDSQASLRTIEEESQPSQPTQDELDSFISFDTTPDFSLQQEWQMVDGEEVEIYEEDLEIIVEKPKVVRRKNRDKECSESSGDSIVSSDEESEDNEHL